MLVHESAQSLVPSPSLSGQPTLSMVEVPAAYGQSSLASSVPSPSVSTAETVGAITEATRIATKKAGKK